MAETAGLAECWQAPAADASVLECTAYSELILLLRQLQDRPGLSAVLRSPERIAASRIVDGALTVLAEESEHKRDDDLRDAVFDLLQRRLATVRHDLRLRLILPRPASTNPVPADFHRLLALRRDVLRALRRRLAEDRLLESENGAPDSQRTLGCFGLRVILCLGHAAPRVLAALMEARDQPLRVAGAWIYLDLSLPETPRHTREHRRLFFDPATAGLWRLLPPPSTLPPRLKAAKRRAERLRQLDHAVTAVLVDGLGFERKAGYLADLRAAAETHLRIHALPLLASYGAGKIASSSLTEDTWLRLVGREFPEAAAVADADADAGVNAIPHADDQPVRVQMEAGEADERGVVSDIRRILRGERRTWQPRLEALIDAWQRDPEQLRPPLAVPLARWFIHLAVARRNKGRLLADGTVRHYFSLVAARLLTVFDTSPETMDAEDLEQAYLDVIALAASAQQSGRIGAALQEFDRYLRDDLGQNLPAVSLPGVARMHYAISARIVSVAEYEAVRALLQGPRMAIESNALREQTVAFVILAFRLGLRRNEILGLTAGDFHWRDPAVLLVRANRIRNLKTRNAERQLPLSVLSPEEAEILQTLSAGRADDTPVFFDKKPNGQALENHGAISLVNQALFRVTGDRQLHPHSLRHSFATLGLLSLLGDEVGLQRLPDVHRWTGAGALAAKALEESGAGALHRKGARGAALGMLTGHGHERTTYEHYVHSLDLLHFAAATQGDVSPDITADTTADEPLLKACLGYAPTTRLRSRAAADLATDLTRRSRGRYRLCPERRETEIPSSGPDRPQLSLEDLKSFYPSSSGARGEPRRQAEIDSACALLDRMERWGRIDRDAVTALVFLLADNLLKGSDWASLSRTQVITLTELLDRVHAPMDVLEVLHVWSPRGSRVNRKQAVPLGVVIGRSWNQMGRFWVRLRDVRRKGPARRQKTQAVVTWTLLRLRDMQDRIDAAEPS